MSHEQALKNSEKYDIIWDFWADRGTSTTFGGYYYGGYTCTGGNGARVTTTLAVTPGSVYFITIGNYGSPNEGGAGGYNGGGSSYVYGYGTGGGGASDIRLSSNTLAARVVVAGGGGGCYAYPCTTSGSGGASGQFGYSGSSCNGYGGGGATASAGGAYTAFYGYSSAGSLGQGGQCSTYYAGSYGYGYDGGGGGGYYGGGGGAASSGGGGSSYCSAQCSGTVYYTGASAAQSGLSSAVVHQSTYSELDVSGASVSGGCSSWSSVLTGDLEPSSYQYKVSSIQMTVVQSLSIASATVACTEYASVKQMLSALLSPADLLTVSCGGHAWKVKQCSSASLAAVCVDCDDPCASSTHCAISASPFSIAPCASHSCGSSVSVVSGGRVLVLGFEELEVPPSVVSQTLSSTKTSISMATKLSRAGSVYCAVYAYSSNLLSSNTVPTSLTQIQLQNHVAATASNNVSTVTVSGLNAVSNYSVYCLAVSTSNIMTPLSTVLSSVHIVQTACCKTINLKSSTTSVAADKSVLNFLSLTLSAAPSSDLQVRVQVFSAATNEMVSTGLVPSVFALSATSSVVQTASLSPLAAGDYYFAATLTGATSSQFSATYGDLSASRQAFSVLSSSQPIPAPVLTSAVFSSDGSYIAISFDSKTDNGGTATAFTCSQLFNFTCAEISSCRWSDSATVNAFVATNDRCTVPGSSLTLLPSVVLKAKCSAASGVCDSSSWPRAVSAETCSDIFADSGAIVLTSAGFSARSKTTASDHVAQISVTVTDATSGRSAMTSTTVTVLPDLSPLTNLDEKGKGKGGSTLRVAGGGHVTRRQSVMQGVGLLNQMSGSHDEEEKEKEDGAGLSAHSSGCSLDSLYLLSDDGEEGGSDGAWDRDAGRLSPLEHYSTWKERERLQEEEEEEEEKVGGGGVSVEGRGEEGKGSECDAPQKEEAEEGFVTVNEVTYARPRADTLTAGDCYGNYIQ
eukprot:gene23171-29364_t